MPRAQSRSWNCTQRKNIAMASHHNDRLTDDERHRLDNDGFVILHDVLSSKQVGAIVERIQQLAETAERDYSREAVIEPEMIKVLDLINGGEVFDVGYTHPRVLAAVNHVLGGDMKFHSMGSRSAPPSGVAPGLRSRSGQASPRGVQHAVDAGRFRLSQRRYPPRTRIAHIGPEPARGTR